MKMTVLAIVSLIGAIAAAGFAWQRTQALEATRLELADANSRLQKAEARIKPLEASVEALRKESEASQRAVEQMRGELAGAKAFFEAERDMGLRLRDELARTKEMLASAMKGRGPQAAAPPADPRSMVPMLVRPAPVRIAPAGAGASVGVATPAK